MQKVNNFEIVLLTAGVATAILGFQLINEVFIIEGKTSWLMVIAIFNWLTLLVLFISLSLAVDITKKQYAETKRMVDLLSQKKGRK